MQLIEYNYIKKFIHKFPRTDIKNLNIYSQSSNNKMLFHDDAKYFIVKTKGKKSYIWFTYYEKNIMCILILMNNKNVNDNSTQVYKIDIQFDNTLCYNNVLLFGYYNKKYFNKTGLDTNAKMEKTREAICAHNFIIENVYNYNILNNIISHDKYNHHFNSKLYLFSKILPLINKSKNDNAPIHNGNTIFNICLPIILNSNDNIFKFIYKFDLDYYSINIYSEHKYLGNYLLNSPNNDENQVINDMQNNTSKKYLYNQELKTEKTEKPTSNYNNVKTKFAYNKLLCNFKDTTCIREDLYNLVIYNNNKEEFYDLALINGYKTSIFMNSIFRKIKENINLDLLEESDEEEEFEDTRKDKFVFLDKHVTMQCMYNYKFKKWIPLKIVNDKIATKTDLYHYLGKNAK
jgi:hypothetical protein